MIRKQKSVTRFPMPVAGFVNRTRVKLCGLTQEHDVRVAVHQGADAIGLVCVPGSKRELSIDRAVKLRALIPSFVGAVLLLSDAEEATATDAINRISPDFVQFHGTESAEYCTSFEVPFFKAISATSGDEVIQAVADFSAAAAILLDSHEPGTMGGTGKVFDWSQIPPDLGVPIILAGGLTADNVREAINMVKPFAVDVSSGIESEAGKKDAKKIHSFIEAVRFVDMIRAQEVAENA